MKKLLIVALALVMAVSLSLVTAAPVGANPGSYSTIMGKACWSAPVDFTDEAGLNWDPLTVGVSYADGKATFVIAPPVAFNPEAPNDNFWLVFDANNDGVEDFQVLYNTRLPSEDPSQTYDFHWAKKAYNGGWGDYQPIPDDWIVSAAGDLSLFTVTIPVSYLGGANSKYGFQIGLVKYIYEDDWQAEWGTVDFDPICEGWSTQALIFVPLPSDGWESQLTPANIEVGLIANVSQLVSITVDPTGIDYGKIAPCHPQDDTLTVSNTGTVWVVVTHEVIGDALFTDHLGVSPGSRTIVTGGSNTFNAHLEVPCDYNAQGVETGTIIFWAEATP